MVTDFCGFGKGVIGKKLPSDTTLNNMKKADLIKLLHTAQHNYETLNWFYNNVVSVNVKSLQEMKEIRAKIIDEFVNTLLNYKSQDEDYKSLSDVCYEIAEQLKGGAE